MESYEEFRINERNEKFRVGYISPVETLSVSVIFDFDNLEKTESLVQFCLEHVEVFIGNEWIPLKTKNKEIYMPIGIEKDIRALNAIFDYMLKNIMEVVFQKSEESSTATE